MLPLLVRSVETRIVILIILMIVHRRRLAAVVVPNCLNRGIVRTAFLLFVLCVRSLIVQCITRTIVRLRFFAVVAARN